MSVGNHSFVIFRPGQSKLAVVGFDSVLLVAALVSEGASVKNVTRKGPLVFMTQALKATLLWCSRAFPEHFQENGSEDEPT